jgi:hypothetical protein
MLSPLGETGAVAQTKVRAVAGPPNRLSDEERKAEVERWKARALEKQRRYKGTRVTPNPEATGDTRALQTRIAGLLAAGDFVPEQRKEHFRWMSKNEQTPITGWHGTILGTVADGDRDGTVVRVKMSPLPVNGFWTASATIERYRFVGGKIHFLDLVYKPGASTWN